MKTTDSKSVSVEIPLADLSFFNDLAELRGWKTSTAENQSGIDSALEDLKNGRVYHAKDADDVLNQILH